MSDGAKESEPDLVKLLDEARYFLNFRQEGPDCDHADLIDEAIDEITDLRSQLSAAEATYLQFCKKHDEKMGRAREALEEVVFGTDIDDMRRTAATALKDLTK